MRTTIAFILLLSITNHFAFAQNQNAYDPEHRYSVQQLTDDFAILRAALEEGHGGLYRYSPKSEIDDCFDETAGSISESMSEPEFLALLAPAIAAINDGHTGYSPSSGFTRHLSRQPIQLPIELRFLNGTAYVLHNHSDQTHLAPGGKVTAINGMSMDTIIQRMFSATSSDGRIETSKYRKLENNAIFGRLFYLLFGSTTSFDLQYVSQAGDTLDPVTVDGLTRAEFVRRSRSLSPGTGRSTAPVKLEYNDNIAVLTIRTFGGSAIQNAGIDYPRFLQSAFEEFQERQVAHLIIDLRDNGGGSDEYGKLLYAYLTPDVFDYYRHLEVNNNRFDFLRFTTNPDRSIPQDRLRQNERGTYDVLGHSNLGPQTPMAPTFTGAVFILINGNSFSATGEFTSVAHHHGRATFVGEECGAGYYGNTSGFMTSVILPNTGIRVRIPLMRYTMAVSGYSPADRGLIPDYIVVPTIDDVLADRDTEMEFVLGLIADRR